MHMGRDLLPPKSMRSWSFISDLAELMLSGLKWKKSLGLSLSTTSRGMLMGLSRLSWKIYLTIDGLAPVQEFSMSSHYHFSYYATTSNVSM
ncbi:hypothetical protein BOTBODRAFT_355594 [Botryobasidium botryosum FD-172 SS1]|uniref:Uncharacterized protein n=1 Tax=Botryobasidium botryosum (strain FD-172 SS1) TaxID=930990 RepID=A0A067MEI9_BOTB1|nr:hypothetical protein BOTBODRAFT_355594 [Botryobasidium botryosum FD-172 SS1]